MGRHALPIEERKKRQKEQEKVSREKRKEIVRMFPLPISKELDERLQAFKKSPSTNLNHDSKIIAQLLDEQLKIRGF